MSDNTAAVRHAWERIVKATGKTDEERRRIYEPVSSSDEPSEDDIDDMFADDCILVAVAILKLFGETKGET